MMIFKYRCFPLSDKNVCRDSENAFELISWFLAFQPSLKSVALSVLTTPDKERGLSYLQSACIEGDIETVNTILNCSPDKLYNAIAVSVKIGHNSCHFPGKSLLTVLRLQDSEKHKQIKERVEKVTENFQSQSLLHVAARKGDVEHINKLLDDGKYVDSRSQTLLYVADRKKDVETICKLVDDDEYVVLQSPDMSETPLMLAARFNDVKVVEYLIEKGASLEKQDDMGFSPIHYAAMGGKTTNILRLIELGDDVLRKVNRRDQYPISLAAEYGHTEAVQLLLEHGADANNCPFYSPLHLAAKNGHLETIQLLLNYGGNLKELDGDYRLPLHCAAEENQTEVVKFLLQNGVTWEMYSVLHLTSRLDVVTLLVENGADIHERDDIGRTPLHAAAAKGQADTAMYLLNQGVDINSRDECGCSALYCALKACHVDTAKVLIDRGCDMKLINDNPFKPDLEADLLHSAARKGCVDILQLLLDKEGFSLNAINQNGETLLMSAARAGQCATVAFLLDQGANINLAGNAGNVKNNYFADYEDSEEDKYLLPTNMRIQDTTPLQCALEAGQSEVAKFLIERGADITGSKNGNFLAKLVAKNGLSGILEQPSGAKDVDFEKMEDGNPSLSLAASRGDLNSVRYLLQKGVDVNERDLSANTALLSVVKFGNGPSVFKIVQLLISSGADINAKNRNSETPLLISCQEDLYNVAELLLERGCETNIKNVDSYSPLLYAVENNNRKLTEMLLQYGADANVKSNDKTTPLHLAAVNRSVHTAELLLQHGADIEATDELGRTGLAEAACFCCLSMVQLLLQYGSNVHAKDKAGKTPLMLAVSDESIPIIKVLLDHGASVNATDQHKRSLLHRISPSFPRDFLDLLLSQGACVNLPDENGETPLHFAASAGNIACIELLLEHGANVGALDIENRSPLHAAAYGNSSSNSTQLLIQHGANVHLADNKGWLPLHLAAYAFSGSLENVEVLVDSGSDVTAVDKKGRTVLHLIRFHNPAELVECLVHHGSDINAKDFRGQTVLGALTQCRYDCLPTSGCQTYLENGGDPFAVDEVTGGTTLHFATIAVSLDAMDNLVNHELELEARDNNGETPLHWAAAKGRPEVIRCLIDRGANVSAVNKKGQTPLLVSLKANHGNASEILLQHRSNVQVADKDGNTALHLAVSVFDAPRILKQIIDNGADVNAVNACGCTPLHETAAACYYQDFDANVALFLLEAGANVDCKDEKGNTPLLIAMAKGHEKMACLLIRHGSDVHAANVQGRTCLHFISHCKFSDHGINYAEGILAQLILNGVQVNAADDLGSTPLHLALLYNCRWLVDGLLKHGSDPEAEDYKGSTPLHVGCYSGSNDAVSAMIDYGR